MTVAGSGFGANEVVDLYAGTVSAALAVTGAGGPFSYAGFVIPGSARPGPFWVPAAGRRSGLAAQAAFTVRVDWPQYGMTSKHASANRFENVINPSTAQDLEVYWRTGAGLNYGGAAINSGFVYFGNDTADVSAVTTAGAQKWMVFVGGSARTTPAATNKTIYVTAGGQVVALDARNGAVRWTHTVDAADATTPVLVGTTLSSAPKDPSMHSTPATVQPGGPVRRAKA